MCLLAIVLIEIAHYEVGTTLGHHSASFWGWLIALVGVIVSAVGLGFRSRYAFLLAPGFGVAIVEVFWQEFQLPPLSPDSSGIAAIILFPLAYAVGAGVGIPSVVLLERLGWRRLWQYMLLGFGCGLGAGLFVALALSARANSQLAHHGPPYYYPWRLCVLLGLLAAVPAYVTYWLIAIRPNLKPRAERSSHAS